MEKISTQKEWISRAQEVFPAGGFGNFDPSVFIKEGRGSRVWDENGNEYVDFLIGSGPMLLGHGHPEVLEAILDQIPIGMTFFTNNSAGVELAEEICRAVTCAEQVRYVTSGSEADMYAIRLARAFTGKSKILKFEGGYHGMCSEAQMSLAPKHLANFPQAVPDSAGIPNSVESEVQIAPFNDNDFLRSFLGEHGNNLAAIILEPLQRQIPPEPGFLETVRDLCSKHNIILIFDEIVTGFRLAYGGAQEYYNVVPDICTLGKIIGGGFPLAAVVGRKEIMQHFDKSKVGDDRFLMQLGTLSGNPVAAVAGLKTLEVLRRENSFNKMQRDGKRIMKIFDKYLANLGVPYQLLGHPTLFDFVFREEKVLNYRDFLDSDSIQYNKFNDCLRQNRLFKAPGKTYISAVLSEEDIDLTEVAISNSVKELV